MDSEQQPTEAAVEEAIETTASPVEQSDDEKLGDLYDKAMQGHSEDKTRDENGRFASRKSEEEQSTGEEGVEVETAGDENAEAEDRKPGEEQEVAAPSYLPQGVRDHWGEIPEAAQEAISRSQSEMSSKLADAGRQMQGIGPIRDALVDMSQEFPELMDMTPEQIVADTRVLATTRVQLLRDPVNTLLSVARQLGALPQMQQALQNATPESLAAQAPLQGQQEVLQQQQLQQQQVAVNVEEAVSAALTERDAEQAIVNFPEGREHWASVEQHMPRFVEAAWAIKGAETPYQGILDAAYNMATAELGLMAGTTPAPEKAQPTVSPKRTEAVLRAKSVNVSSGTGKAKPKSERDALAEAYDRMMTN